jgi:hypothetical protein
MYRHKQTGYVILLFTLAVPVGVAAIVMRNSPAAAVAIIATFAIIALLFSSLTIEVRDGMLRSHFGPGFWKKQWPLSDIADARPTRSSIVEGWGIRVTARGMLYNVSGTGAVEVVTRSGKRFRLGTDEPEALANAIRAALPPSAGRSA